MGPSICAHHGGVGVLEHGEPPGERLGVGGLWRDADGSEIDDLAAALLVVQLIAPQRGLPALQAGPLALQNLHATVFGRRRRQKRVGPDGLHACRTR